MEKFDIIYIMLGFRCNFDCIYCLQEDVTDLPQTTEIDPKVFEFLDKYPYKWTTSICFFGGEPLLYCDAIKQIVERYAGKYYFKVISNGSLLDEEKVAFFNKYGVNFTLSHDAHNTRYTRKTDVWEQSYFLKCFHALDCKSINVTVTSASRPLKEIFEYYPYDVPLNINYVMNTHGTDAQKMLAEFDLRKYQEDVKYLLEKYEQGEWREMQVVGKILKTILAYTKDEDKDLRCYECVYGAKTLNIDLEGNIAFCHNSATRIGAIEDDYKVYGQEIKKRLQEHRKSCKDCQWSNICGGACALLKGHGKDQYCRRLHALYELLIPWIKGKGGEILARQKIL